MEATRRVRTVEGMAAVIAATADRRMVVRRPGDMEEVDEAIQPRRRTAPSEAVDHAAALAGDRTAGVVPMAVEAEDRMEAGAVLTEAIAKATT